MRIFTDRRCLAHPAPPGFPERPERLQGILARLAAAPARQIVETSEHPATAATLHALHDPRYVERFRRAAERGDGLLDTADNPIAAASFAAARAALSATLAGLDEALAGRPAFAAVRPPGHHAERDRAMGFCFFNNVAAAAERARALGLERVAILDFDVHHGNGTQHLFEARGDVFYASLHQYPFYPGSGAPSERGRGAGLGTTLNVPLPAGAGDAEYAAALAGEILPAMRAFRPGLLLVSAGFDAWRDDPLGGMRVSRDGFAAWGRDLARLAGEVCAGRLLSVLEGGYDLAALPELVESYLDAQYAEIT